MKLPQHYARDLRFYLQATAAGSTENATRGTGWRGERGGGEVLPFFLVPFILFWVHASFIENINPLVFSIDILLGFFYLAV